MIFYRALNNPAGTQRSLSSVRALVLTSLASDPGGALLRQFGPDTLAVQLGGLLLILFSLICLALLAGSQLSRITGEEAKHLDEYEARLRAQAMAAAYNLLTGLVMLGIIYLALARDFGWWFPDSYDEWNATFWGLFLYATLLPIAVLAFRLKADDLEPAEATP